MDERFGVSVTPGPSAEPWPLSFPDAAVRLVRIGASLQAQGWVQGTSGNLSAVLAYDPLRLAITPSGTWKGALTPAAILEVQVDGTFLTAVRGRPSAETLLHAAVVRATGAGAVLHTHSVWATLLSDLHGDAAGLTIERYEMLKGLAGVTTHEHREWVPILENDQEMPRLAANVASVLQQHPAAHGVLLRRHGLYTWGRDLDEALRHVEIFEFLFEVVGRTRSP